MVAFDGWVSGLVTTTAAAPATPPGAAGAVQVMVVAETKATAPAGSPPIATVAPDWKPLPVMVIAVPPARGPPIGDTAPTTGAGA